MNQILKTEELETREFGAGPSGKVTLSEPLLDWDYDINESARRQAKIAWVIAALSLVLASLSIVALMVLLPLKEIEPIFVRVDSATGGVDVLHNISEEVTLERQDLLDKGFLARYLRAREGYFFPTVKENFRRVMQMSVGDARRSYERKVSTENPEAPLNTYKDDVTVDITIKSISFLEKGLAQVRYIATTLDAGSETRGHWIATIEYQYQVGAKIPLSVLADNPLGFAVTAYRSEPEDAQ